MNAVFIDYPYKPYKELEEKMKRAGRSKMTKAEVRAQRISWVYGNLPKNSPLTREDVARIVDERDGVDE